jgi:hypothetical protein
MRFRVLYCRNIRSRSDPTDCVLVAEVPNRWLAKNSRQVSGDLVFDATTNRLELGYWWLWDWERKDPNCYARQQIRLHGGV